VFSVAGVSNLTINGATNETILGAYFRLWLTKEGMLTGKDAADASSVYFRANNGQLIMDTAKAFWAGFLPGASVNVNSYPLQDNDPLFSPVAAGLAQIDERMAVAAVTGRLGDSAPSFTTAYAPELALTRSILFNYPVSQTPAPATPAGKLDVTTLPIAVGFREGRQARDRCGLRRPVELTPLPGNTGEYARGSFLRRSVLSHGPTLSNRLAL
jgi:hypothetical protein